MHYTGGVVFQHALEVYPSMHCRGWVCIPACTAWGRGDCIPACTGGCVSQHALPRGVSQHALPVGGVFQHALPVGVVYQGVYLGGVSQHELLGGVSQQALSGGCLSRRCMSRGCLPRGYLPRGVSAQGLDVYPVDGGSVWEGRGSSPQDLRQTPPCGQTDTCENITFANFICGW